MLMPGDRHERHHVGGADARVGTAVLVQVDQFGGFPDGPESGFFHRRGRPGEGDHAAVVVVIGTVVEQGDFGHAGDGSQDGFDHFRAAGF